MRILIAEDDPFSQRILKLMLETEQRYEVIAVGDGLAAWRELDEGLGFNLCILDIMMPGLDGLELLAKLRADTRFAQQRVMLCTALNDRQTIDRAAALGVSHYIVKPFAKEHVLRQVRHACAETAAAVYFESITDVAARLGVATTGVREFLHGLHTDAEALQATLSLGRSPESMRVNALKSAAVNLGARSLAARLGQLEGVLLTTGDWSRVAPALAVEIERLRAQLRIAKPDGSAAVDASADGAAAPLGSPASTPAVETAAAMATDVIKPAAAPAPAS